MIRSFTAFFSTFCVLVAGAASADESVRIVLAGDSTVTDNAGWGHGFRTLLTDEAECINLAKSGRSSRSFRAEGWWQECLDAKPDYLLIQFGHNDQPGKGPERESAAESDFRAHLAAFVREAREYGIKPVLVTSLTRRRWSLDGHIVPTLAEYAAATTAVAQEQMVPLIDLHRLSIQQCEALGPTAFAALEPTTKDGPDHTHLNPSGGLAVAELVATELIRVCPELGSCFDPSRMEAARTPPGYRRDLSHGALRIVEDDSVVTVSEDEKTVLVYHKKSPPVPDGIAMVYQRSGFLHPICSPGGHVVTAAFPADHPHQHGVFTAWVKTTWNRREIDFWNLAGGTGRVLHHRVLSTFTQNDQVGFEARLIHRAEQEPVADVLEEVWRITVSPADGTCRKFDLETKQSALTDVPLIIQKYHYGGVAMRGPVEWLNKNDADKTEGLEISTTGCEFLNDLGSDRRAGNHQKARWILMSGELHGMPVSIVVMSHPENFRFPQAARLHPSKPYFCFAPCVDDQFVIDREHPFSSRYRYLVLDTHPNREWIEDRWQEWLREVSGQLDAN